MARTRKNARVVQSAFIPTIEQAKFNPQYIVKLDFCGKILAWNQDGLFLIDDDNLSKRVKIHSQKYKAYFGREEEMSRVKACCVFPNQMMFAVAFNPENIIIFRYNQALNEVIEVLNFTLFVKRGGRDDINQVQMFKLGSKLCVTGHVDCETICKEIHVVDMKNIKKPEIFKWEKDFLSVRPYTIQELPNFQNHFAITIDPDVETCWLQCKIQILSKEKIAKVKLIRKLDYDGVSINYRTISPWTSDIIPFPDGKSDCRVAYEIDTSDESGNFFLSLKRLSYQPFNHSLKHLEREVRGKSNINQVQTDTIERKRVEFIMGNIDAIELLPSFGRSFGEGRYFLYRTNGISMQL